VEELSDEVSFPVYVLAKDCSEIRAFASRQAMQNFMEPIDVENDEYEAWDSHRNCLRLAVTKPKTVWLRVVKTDARVSTQKFDQLRKRAREHVEPEPLLRAIARKLGRLRTGGQNVRS